VQFYPVEDIQSDYGKHVENGPWRHFRNVARGSFLSLLLDTAEVHNGIDRLIGVQFLKKK
jgi:hypothetical protein